MRSFSLRRIPGTYGVLVFVGAVYAAQLAIAGTAVDGAAASAVYMLPDAGFWLFNPWMHSEHMHLVQNSSAFVILGWWAERTVGTQMFVNAVVAAGYITNSVPILTGFGGHTVGISGITNMLWTLLMLTLLFRFFDEISDSSTSDLKPGLNLLLSLAILGLIVGQSVAEFVGVLPAQQGVAKGTHFLGVVLGVIWFGSRMTFDVARRHHWVNT